MERVVVSGHDSADHTLGRVRALVGAGGAEVLVGQEIVVAGW